MMAATVSTVAGMSSAFVVSRGDDPHRDRLGLRRLAGERRRDRQRVEALLEPLVEERDGVQAGGVLAGYLRQDLRLAPLRDGDRGRAGEAVVVGDRDALLGLERVLGQPQAADDELGRAISAGGPRRPGRTGRAR